MTKKERLLNGETFVTSERGQSMTPLIKSGQEHELSPVKVEQIVVGDIVYCKVRKNYYTHIVKSIDPNRGFLIGNNHGLINGWTKKIYGKVTKIL